MMQIKLVIYSIVLLIVLSSITIAIYYNNKFKNYQLKHQEAVIQTQEKNIVTHNETQEKMVDSIDILDKKHISQKKELRQKFNNSGDGNKVELYNEQFLQIINEIEVISGNEISSD